MQVKLVKPLDRATSVDPFDVTQVKKSLNRLGYYQPLITTGITAIPDAALFAAIKAFQTDRHLPATGTLKPSDDTLRLLNDEIAKTPDGYYIWRTVEDTKVRGAHADLNRTIRAWSDTPDPGESYNCRCWAEPIVVPNDVKPALDDVLEKLTGFDQDGYALSARFLRHYLNRTGQPITLLFDTFKDSAVVQSALQMNRKRFQDDFLGKIKVNRPTSFKRIISQMKDGDKIRLSDHWDVDKQKTDIDVFNDDDFATSIGSGKIRSTGTFDVVRQKDVVLITGHVMHVLDDRYDFNNDAFIDRRLFKNERKLAETFYAKPFDVHWQATQEFAGHFIVQQNEMQQTVFTWSKISDQPD